MPVPGIDTGGGAFSGGSGTGDQGLTVNAGNRGINFGSQVGTGDRQGSQGVDFVGIATVATIGIVAIFLLKKKG